MTLFPSPVAPTTVTAGPRVFQFFAPGSPKGQPRPRAFGRKMGEKFVVRMYEAGTAEAWKGDIARAAEAYRPATPIEVACRVDIEFLFARPQRLLKKSSPQGRIDHTAKPDRDNLDKAVLDCLTQIGFFKDDAIVCKGEPSKFYAAVGEVSGAWITIKVLEGGQS